MTTTRAPMARPLTDAERDTLEATHYHTGASTGLPVGPCTCSSVPPEMYADGDELPEYEPARACGEILHDPDGGAYVCIRPDGSEHSHHDPESIEDGALYLPHHKRDGLEYAPRPPVPTCPARVRVYDDDSPDSVPVRLITCDLPHEHPGRHRDTPHGYYW